MINSAYWFNKQHFKTGQEHQFNLIWLFIIALSIILVGIGLRDPWPADEPRFAQVAREMVETGQWFFPMRGGELYPDKPPVFMWSIAILYWLTDSITVSFLLPSAICSIVTCFLVYDLGRRLWSSQIGWYASLLLLSTIQFVLQAKAAQIDAMVCCWITIGCYGLARHLLLGENWRWYFTACFFMGIGIITKGVGFLPIFMLIPYVALRIIAPQESEIKGEWRWLTGLLVLLGTTLLWLIPMLYWVEQSQNPLLEQYRDNILFKQTGERYANAWHHLKPFWYYLIEVIPIFWLPTCLLLPWLIKHWYRAILQLDRRIILLLGWVVLVVIFFSYSPGKRGVYLLPALPMLSLVVAPYLSSILSKKWPKLLIWSFVFISSLCALLTGIVGIVEIKSTLKLTEKYHITPWFYLFTLGAIGQITAWLTYRNHRWLSWPIASSMVWILYSTWGYQLLNPVKTPKNVYLEITKKIPKNSELAIIGLKEQLIYFSPYTFSHFGYHTKDELSYRAAWKWQGENQKRFVLTYKRAMHVCYDLNKALPVGYAHRREWLLLPSTSRLAQCEPNKKQINRYTFSPRMTSLID
ncbi:glycosyltransferase family 39 protein [Colwellia sp. MB3u-4]|uniref:ArnT family glycosyltransferase n=1 Tax=Colwellia sp. MB3u-4 TaxID=2759822 RepID=UPI0015F7555C|nr:glycosyltransferase family 39 protein [Colwellia sp. MB3u-4]MBA6290215.1 glycosyltransferase family 39 protein [Colwellia sp. MB3u-4]